MSQTDNSGTIQNSALNGEQIDSVTENFFFCKFLGRVVLSGLGGTCDLGDPGDLGVLGGPGGQSGPCDL